MDATDVMDGRNLYWTRTKDGIQNGVWAPSSESVRRCLSVDAQIAMDPTLPSGWVKGKRPDILWVDKHGGPLKPLPKPDQLTPIDDAERIQDYAKTIAAKDARLEELETLNQNQAGMIDGLTEVQQSLERRLAKAKSKRDFWRRGYLDQTERINVLIDLLEKASQ